jgi:hypothetical protein
MEKNQEEFQENVAQLANLQDQFAPQTVEMAGLAFLPIAEIFAFPPRNSSFTQSEIDFLEK